MRIASSTVDFSSTHLAAERSTRRESLRSWSGERRPDFEALERGGARGGPGRGDEDGRLNDPNAEAGSSSRALMLRRVAGLARKLEADAAAQAKRAQHHEQKAEASSSTDEAYKGDPKTYVIKLLVEAMTGRKIKLVSLEDVQQAQANGDATLAGVQQGGQQPQRAGWGVEYELHETFDEFEQASFSARGVVKTADGKEISFSYELEMERAFHSETNVSVRAGDALLKDPLVINFGGTAAQLTDWTYAFDLDADGTKDQVAWVQSGSGFLALDRNDNGAIDDGTELFGAQTGDGFAELATYDDDRNGWIDEADAVYDRLQVWSKSGEADQLAGLRERNVGAIYLAQQATPFELKDDANQLQGAIRASGVYVKEDGTGVGSVQQIDLAV